MYGIHARGRLAGADRADHHDAGIEAALGNREPRGFRCTAARRLEMALAEHEGGRGTSLRRHVGGQRTVLDSRRMPIRDDGRERTKHRARKERRREPQRGIAVHQDPERGRIPEFDQLQVHVGSVDGIGVETDHANTRGDQRCHQCSLRKKHAKHATRLSMAC